MRATGTALHVIAANLQIDVRTLRKHFKPELEIGQEQVVAALSASVIRAGLNGDWRAALAWLARWGPEQWRGHMDHGQDYGPLGQAMAAAAGLDGPVQVYLPENGRPPALDAAHMARRAPDPQAPDEAPEDRGLMGNATPAKQ